MQTSHPPFPKKAALLALTILLSPILYAFSSLMTEQEWILWINKCLVQSYEPPVEPKLKGYEITLTTDHFIRLRKTFQQGKQEYYSINLQHFSELGYIASSASIDTLDIKTRADDIIVQTYDDPKGNVDSMATHLKIPVTKLSALQLDSLKQGLNFLKKKSL
jgi:hypothetical protein